MPLPENQCKVLVIDDEPNIRELLKRILERHGYAVFTAADGQEGLETLKANLDIDIAFTDITMPKLSGLDFLKQARHINPKIEVVIITGHSDVQSSVEAVEFGASGYLIKPLQVAEIISHLKRASMRIQEKTEILKKVLAHKKASA
jgi:DNA-binding NtrC family response regulator